MNDRQEFFRRSEEMFRLYRLEKYEDALKVVNRLATEFPRERVTTTFWRICLLSRSRQIEAALRLMSSAMEDGLWWSEMQLRSDSDLDPLQGLADFERMVAECNLRHAAAQAGASPGLMVYEPGGKASGPRPLLIALHARGSSPERDLHNWLPVTERGWLLAMPQSSQLGSPDTFVWDDEDLARKELSSHFDELCARYQVETGRIILAGFSQGGARAIQFALAGTIPVRGFLSVVPGRVALEQLDSQLSDAAGHGLRGYLVAGGLDDRYESFVQLHNYLLEHNIPCEFENHPDMGHQFPADFELTLAKALDFILKE